MEKQDIKTQTNFYPYPCHNPIGRSVDIPPYNHYLICGLQKISGAHVHAISSYITGYNLMWEHANGGHSGIHIDELLIYEAKLQTVYAGLVLNGTLCKIQS